MIFSNYTVNGLHDEAFEATNKPRKSSEKLIERINELPKMELKIKQHAAELDLLNMGVTFTLSGTDNAERIIPFDILPRIIESKEWDKIHNGLQQRIQALNAFLNDIYSDQKIIKDKIIPIETLNASSGYLPAMQNIKPPHGLWCHITGSDLIRDKNGNFLVLEDNLRCPSGVSYVLWNRSVMKRTFPDLFMDCSIKPVDDYPTELLQMLQSLAPSESVNPNVVLLTPGTYNSAYFEHAFLALQMGIDLVEGRDLYVKDNFVYMKTTQGLQKVDVIYRRVNDDYLDPEVFNKDSLLGIPGLIRAYQAGHVALANAPGTGAADDKAMYSFVPKMIKYYLSEDPILENVETYLCANKRECDHVLKNLDKLVVKSVGGAGGYGMLMGPSSTKKERDEFKKLLTKSPENYIAQPVVDFSVTPTIINDRVEPRHIDLRPFILNGKNGTYVMPGGLTRVALKNNSLVVNSSQGGGSKDTWVTVGDA